MRPRACSPHDATTSPTRRVTAWLLRATTALLLAAACAACSGSSSQVTGGDGATDGADPPDIRSQAPSMNVEQALLRAREDLAADTIAGAERAVDTLTLIVSEDPSNAEAYHLRGVALMRLGLFNDAFTSLKSAIEIAPSADAYFNLGNVLQRRGYYDRAALAYEAALELSPDDPEILNNLASALAYSDRHVEALTLLDKVIAQRPSDAHAHTNRGVILYMDQDFAAAERAYRQAIQVDANHYPAHFNLARLLMDTNRLDAAAASLREYLRVRPDAPDRQRISNIIEQISSGS